MGCCTGRRRPLVLGADAGRLRRRLLAALGRLLVLAAGIAIGLTMPMVLLGGPAAVRGIEREAPRPESRSSAHGAPRRRSAPRQVWTAPGGLEIAAYGARSGRHVGDAFELSRAVLSLAPRVVLLRSFASDAECDALRQIAAPKMKASKTYALQGDELLQKSESRTSSSAKVDARKDVTGNVPHLERKLADALMVDRATFEAWAVLNYQKGQHYWAHFDYLDEHLYHKRHHMDLRERPERQRMITVLLYLTEPESGGETSFPNESRVKKLGKTPGSPDEYRRGECNLGIKVRPERGDAIYFESLGPDTMPDYHSMHEGCDVVSGEKWVATKWIQIGSYPPATAVESGGAGAAGG